MRKILFFGVLAILLLARSASAANGSADAAQKTPAELIASTVKVIVNKDDPDQRNGSGFFVDPAGCFLTAAHVVMRTDVELPYDNIEIAYSKDIKRKPEIIGKAKVVFSDLKTDMAVACVDTPDFFPELELAAPEEAEALTFGDNLKIIGYPKAGSDSVTFAPSTIIGFWNAPDLKSIGGADKIDGSKINLIKTDGISGSGGSGSPILNKNNRVVAIMFAGQSHSAVPGLSIVIDVIRDWREKARTAAAVAGCAWDKASGVYSKEGQKFYDSDCSRLSDQNLENMVLANVQDICPNAKPDDWKIKSAAGHIKNGSSLDKWYEYLTKTCAKPAPVVKSDTPGKTITPAEPVSGRLTGAQVKSSVKNSAKSKKASKPAKVLPKAKVKKTSKIN